MFDIRKIGLVLFSIVILILTNSANAEPLKIKSVPARTVPGLIKYIRANYPDLKITRDSVKVRLVDLDEKPDGRDEVLLEIVDFANYCGSKGCDVSVLERDGSGRFRPLVGLISYDIIVIEGYNKGKRNLAMSKDRNATLVRFNGKNYEPILGGVAKLRMTSTKPEINPNRRKEFSGKCHKGYVWSGGPRDPQDISAGSVAGYRGCGDGESTFYFVCYPTRPTIDFYIEIDVHGLKDGSNVMVQAKVGRKRYKLKGTGSYSEMIGGTQPILKLKKSSRFFSELKKASSLSLKVGRERIFSHLKGSSGAIDAMFAFCH